MLELFSSRAQNQFFRALEDWLATITRISIAGDAADGDQVSAAAALMEHNSTQITELTALVAEMVAKLEENRERGPDPEEGPRQTALLARIADRLENPIPPRGEDGEPEVETGVRIRNIDRQILRLTEELATGRQEAVAELRAELGGVSRALTQLAERAGRN